MACCPLPSAPTTVSATVCLFNLREVHRVWVVREGEVIYDISTPANNVPASITALAPEDSAPWTILRVAADSTKVLTLPLFGSEPTVTAGAEISSTGLSNRKNHVGFDPSEFVAFFEGLTAAQETEIDAITCEGETLEVYFILNDKSIVGKLDVATSNLFTGIPIESAMILLGRSLNGINENDKNEFQFQLDHSWSHTITKLTPTFNTLTY